MKNTAFIFIVLLLLFCSFRLAAQSFLITNNTPDKKNFILPELEKSNIIVNSSGTSFHDAMPTGNGDIGVSMWVEKDGDLQFYISKTDAYDDNNRLLKLGLVRVKIFPNPFKKDSFFLQELKLKQSEIIIQTGSGKNSFNIRLWVDANNPVIRVEMKADNKFKTVVQLQNWRRQLREIVDDISFSDPYNTGFDGVESNLKTIQYPDSILKQTKNEITWYHKNEHSCWPFTLKLQGLEELTKTQTDPLLNNIFGASINGDGLMQQNDTTLFTLVGSATQNISVHILGKSATSQVDWLTALQKQKKRVDRLRIKECRTHHQQWWAQFWNRSFINIRTISDTGALITRSYNLQRYMVACSGRGKGWIKFNGSIFTLPNEKDADFRRWGSAEWFQNARLLYWPAINAGDFDLLSPFYSIYLNALPLAKKRTAIYYSHGGAFFSEASYSWGSYVNGDYGFNRKGNAIGFATNPYIRRHWTCGLELTAMMLHQYNINGNTHFFRDTLLPIATEITRFYDEHWKRGTDGKILFDPSQALETWQTTINPMPEIAGLKFVLKELISLPKNLTSPAQRNRWINTLNDLPDLPKKTTIGKTILLAAKTVTQSFNSENPELYAVFPFKIFGVSKSDLDIGRNTFAARINKESRCWYQDDAQAAYLGLTKEAAIGVAKRMTDWNKEYVFPAMWGSGDDGLPDFDHGGVGQLALQAMLLQTDKTKILIFPAWPKNWDV